MRMAIAELRHALSLDPKFVDALVLLSVIHVSAQFLDPERIDEDLAAAKQAADRAIQEQRMHWQVGLRYLDEAAAAKIRDLFNAQMVAMLGAPAADALAELQRAFEASADNNPKLRRDIALWAGNFGDPQLALAAMRRVVDARPAEVLYVWMPQLAKMRALPEFKSFMIEIGMVEYWKRHGWPPFCWEVDANNFGCH